MSISLIITQTFTVPQRWSIKWIG